MNFLVVNSLLYGHNKPSTTITKILVKNQIYKQKYGIGIGDLCFYTRHSSHKNTPDSPNSDILWLDRLRR